VTHPLHGLEPTQLPPELRARVLSAAKLTEPADWCDRLYEDGHFWAAAGALAVLLLAGLFLPLPQESVRRQAPVDAQVAILAIQGDGAEPAEQPTGSSLAEQWPRLQRELSR
jgi:hypothetical protein